MAIGYARVEFVKRSEGKTSCAKAAYNSRTLIEFEGNCALEPQVYDWSSKESPEFHTVLLPEGVDSNFQIPEVLWNAVESKEKRYNSQVDIDLVLALPDDKELTIEDRIELATKFVKEQIVDKGLAAQIDIHPPERRIQFTKSDDRLSLSKGTKGSVVECGPDRLVVCMDKEGRLVEFNPRDFSGYSIKEHNWHAHVLIAPRRFKENGRDFEDRKPRELMPQIRKGKVIAGPDWGKLWSVHQNLFFEERGWALRVDPNGIIAQEHLGPVRMRARAFSLIEENARRIELNADESKDPAQILSKLTERLSVFAKDDVDRFLQKHVRTEVLSEVREGFWKQEDLVQLVDKRTGELLDKFTSQAVVKEEKQAIRLADRLHAKEAFSVKNRFVEQCGSSLNIEQKRAFEKILAGERLGLIQGFAGTGKGYLLSSLREAYTKSGVHIRAFGPDNATVDVLREKGFSGAENVYKFLFATHHGNRTFSAGKEVWMLDEAGKLGNRPLLEILKEADKRGAQVVFAGDPAQLPSVERGGLFDLFCKKYGSQVFEEIQRQKTDKQREIARNLAVGEVGGALDRLCEVRGLKWSEDKRGAIETLVQRWSVDRQSFPDDKLLMVAHTNSEVRVLNEMARVARKQTGELDEREFSCETTQGKIYVGVGDRIEFRKNDRDLGVTNGLAGTLVSAEDNQFVVSVQEDKKRTRLVTFNPQEYHAYQLGYASTFYRSQGRTVDRAYVLHGDLMNKEMFYVGLTRHVKKAEFYLSKEKIYSLSDLKRQLSRDGKKTTTLEFTTHEEIKKQQEIAEKEKGIEKLKGSSEALDKMKGHGLSILDTVSRSFDEIVEKFRDRRPDKNFYAHSEDVSGQKKANIFEVPGVSKGVEPLYNHRQLKERPLAAVVVVHSDKAADAAPEKFPGKDYVFVSGDAKKADWGALIGKKVVVWPLNSKEGFKEAENVCDELKKICPNQLYLMKHPKVFNKLPEKWDLSSEWPKGINSKLLNFYFPGEEKGRLYSAAFKKMRVPEKDILERSKIANVLSHFEKRQEPIYREKIQGASTENEKQKIWKEYKSSALEFIGKQKDIEAGLKKDPMVCVSSDLAKRLAHQVLLFEAKHGKVPSSDQIILMKEVVGKIGAISVNRAVPEGRGVVRNYALDQLCEAGCEIALKKLSFSKEDLEKLKEKVGTTESYLSQQVERMESFSKAIELQKVMQRETGKSQGLDYNS